MVFCRKRKDNRTPSFMLDDSPKRSKVQAQRKFAQGSNVNSPVLTPVSDIEVQEKVLPEPIELLPMKRPNTEDFLTFLCFRGTPALPPNLNFFNNASMSGVQTPISESSCSNKNGVILANNISSKSQGEKPFIAFGVRKRADPIVVSRHMDKKRRHALALQALRRKYQEQKMAKIRAITISKLSEKVQTNKTVVRTTRSISKPEPGPVPKKTVAQKTKITVVATKRVVTRRTSQSQQPLRTLKTEMCLRGLRGRIAAKRELLSKIKKKNKPVVSKQSDDSYIDEETEEESDSKEKVVVKKEKSPITKKKLVTKKILETKTLRNRVTRSNPFGGKEQTKTRRILVRRQAPPSKSPSVSPKGKPQIQRKVLRTAAKPELKVPIKRQMLKRSLAIKNNNLARKAELEVKQQKNKQKEETNTKNDNKITPKETPKVSKKSTSPIAKNLRERNTVNEEKKPDKVETRSSAQEKEATKKTNDKKSPEKKVVEEKKRNSVTKEKQDKTPKTTPKVDAKAQETKSKISPKKAEDKKVPVFVDSKKIKIDDVIIEELDPKPTSISNSCKSKTRSSGPIKESTTITANKKQTKQIPEKEKEPPKPQTKTENPGRPPRKTKMAAAIYMEILGRKLVNDEGGEDGSNDSFPELPNVKKTEQRENELKALKGKGKKFTKEATKKEAESTSTNKQTKDSENKKITKEVPVERRQTRNQSQQKQVEPSTDSDDSFTAEIETPPLKLARKTRKTSPKLYKSFTDTDSDGSTDKVTKSKVSAITKAKEKRPRRSANENKTKTKGESFSESDEEPLSKFTKKSSEKGKPENKAAPGRKPKRECAKKPQNYGQLFSSSDEEVRQEEKKPLKPENTNPQPTEALSTKDLGRRFGKGKVNMSNAQIEKWLNDSVMAGMSLIKKENDEMLKFGERIPTETSLNSSLNAVNVDQLKTSLITPKVDTPKEAGSLQTTPEKSSVEIQKPTSNEKKTIFKKSDSFSKNCNAFSVCNESSVYAFEADNEDSVSTPFRRPSRRPSSTATSRSEDDVNVENKAVRFRHPENISNKIKQEVSLMLTDESNNSESITVQVNIENTDGPSAQKESNDNEHLFYIPLQPGQKTLNNIQGVAIKMGTSVESSSNPKLIMSAKLVRQNEKTSTPPMFPPSAHLQIKKEAKAKISIGEASDDFKYKVPSSPSASSSSSAKLVNRKLHANEDFFKPINVTEFPTTKAAIVDAPIFKPTEKEFLDPLEYIEKIREKAEKFGVCRIIPPANFKPECKVLDEMRFTAYNQYVHKMMHRWGPNFREFVAIRKYLATQSITFKHPPWIGGMEIDLPKLYQTVQTLGGLKEVIEKKKWPRVSELMNIPKSAQDRVTKLDDIYCKYLLPYDTLSPDEREKLFKSVEAEWAKREEEMYKKAQGTYESDHGNDSGDENDEEEDEEDENDIECIVKGRNLALSAFYRIARNTMAMWFKNGEPTADEVEQEFWKHLTQKEHHICVHSGSIDSGNLGYGFAISKNSPFARHAWNLKVLTNNSGSILRSMGPVMGLTVPTLHVGMVFAGCCWYRDPHSLPWIEYLHTGANKIWYSIPDSMSEKFHSVMLKLVPNYCLNKSLWLPTDTVMVPPNILVEHGISLCRIVQEPGQFVVVFPKAFTSNICAGYVVSESVFWAPPSWLQCAEKVFANFRSSCEPSMFSYERLLLSIAADGRSDISVLRKIIPLLEVMIAREKKERTQLRSVGVTKSERLSLLDPKKKKKMQDTDTEYICEECRWNLYCSMVTDNEDNGYYCIEHAISNIQSKELTVENCKLVYTYDDEELNGLIKKIESTIESKILKKAGSKFSGMATLLNR